jgi:lipopolysaccharide transport system ATP-binding protein
MTYAIEASALSKRYDLGEGSIANLVRRRKPADEFWALRDVEFTIREGEAVGIIGANGAGKSTLLKVLSRITAPTRGSARIRGRIGAILEVGTGFHPELTGRENVYLGGAILGMSPAEVKARFDEIVDFAAIEKFIDTPVKRYSSGMYVRLAFAVAAHLEPDILIVDEVLAVGDVGFQKKCLAKLDGSIHQEGRTILMVSHNMQAVGSVCSRGLLLEGGELVGDGAVNDVIGRYARGQKTNFDLRERSLKDRLNRTAGRARITDFSLVTPGKSAMWTFNSGDPVAFRFRFETNEPLESLSAMIYFTGRDGDVVTTMRDVLFQDGCNAGNGGEVTIEIPRLPLRPGDYGFTLALGNADFSLFEDILDANVNFPRFFVDSTEQNWFDRVGVFSADFSFKCRPEMREADFVERKT